MPSHSLWRSLGLTALGLIIGSLSVEGCLRLAELEPFARALPAAQASLYGPDPDTGYAHRAGSRGLWLTENRAWVEINDLGLRDRADRKARADAARMRVAIVGDSVIEAIQVRNDQTMASVAERMLGERRSSIPVEVVNLGLAGATPAVTVERLRAHAAKLELDAAIVVLNVGELLRNRPDDPSELVGYVPGPDGKAVLSHAFRETRGYRFRTGTAGRAMYWLLDRSRLALLLNNRKNAGLLAELAEPPRARSKPARPCSAETLAPHEELWSGRAAGFAQARVTAILRDLADVGRERQMPVVLALVGLPPSCPEAEDRLALLREAVGRRIEHADGQAPLQQRQVLKREGLQSPGSAPPVFGVPGGGLQFLDLIAAVARHIPPGKTMRDLTGWGARIGTGHLNELGHQVYAAAIVEHLSGGR